MTLHRTAEIDLDDLMDEVRRYLVAVEVFRAEGQEPRWSPEPRVAPPAPRRRHAAERSALS